MMMIIIIDRGSRIPADGLKAAEGVPALPSGPDEALRLGRSHFTGSSVRRPGPPQPKYNAGHRRASLSVR
eukprot:716785-Rhodomonas_salina.1